MNAAFITLYYLRDDIQYLYACEINFSHCRAIYNKLVKAKHFENGENTLTFIL